MRLLRLAPLLGLVGCLGPPSFGTWGYFGEAPGRNSIGCHESVWEPDELAEALEFLRFRKDGSPDFTICPTDGAWLLGKAIDLAYGGVWPDGLEIAGRDDDPDDDLSVKVKIPQLTLGGEASLQGGRTAIQVIGDTNATCDGGSCALDLHDVRFSNGVMQVDDPGLNLSLQGFSMKGDARWSADAVIAAGLTGTGTLDITATGEVRIEDLDLDRSLSIVAKSAELSRVTVETPRDPVAIYLKADAVILDDVDIDAFNQGLQISGPADLEVRGAVAIHGHLVSSGARLDLRDGSGLTHLRVAGSGPDRVPTCLGLVSPGAIGLGDVELSRCDVGIDGSVGSLLDINNLTITDAGDCLVATDTVDLRDSTLDCDVGVRIPKETADCTTAPCSVSLRSGYYPGDVDVQLGDGSTLNCGTTGLVEWEGKGELVSATGCTP